MTAENDALAQAAQWVAQLATGSIATGAATIAIAAIGFAMLAGRVDVRRGATVVIGCFILFAAPRDGPGIRAMGGQRRFKRCCEL